MFGFTNIEEVLEVQNEKFASVFRQKPCYLVMVVRASRSWMQLTHTTHTHTHTHTNTHTDTHTHTHTHTQHIHTHNTYAH